MQLLSVIKERERKKTALRKDAVSEARRLTLMLSERFHFDSIYIYGSVLTGGFGHHSDIDMVIKGLRAEDFFKAHAFLIREGRYRIDLKPFEELSVSFMEKVLKGGKRVG
jgi:predicted nucleotidyltransferase